MSNSNSPLSGPDRVIDRQDPLARPEPDPESPPPWEQLAPNPLDEQPPPDDDDKNPPPDDDDRDPDPPPRRPRG